MTVSRTVHDPFTFTSLPAAIACNPRGALKFILLLTGAKDVLKIFEIILDNFRRRVGYRNWNVRPGNMNQKGKNRFTGIICLDGGDISQLRLRPSSVIGISIPSIP
jgi:hypothetical protein